MPPIRNAGDLPGMSFTHGVINYDPRQTEDRGQISSRGLCSDEETFLFSFKVESKSPCVLRCRAKKGGPKSDERAFSFCSFLKSQLRLMHSFSSKDVTYTMKH